MISFIGLAVKAKAGSLFKDMFYIGQRHGVLIEDFPAAAVIDHATVVEDGIAPLLVQTKPVHKFFRGGIGAACADHNSISLLKCLLYGSGIYFGNLFFIVEQCTVQVSKKYFHGKLLLFCVGMLSGFLSVYYIPYLPVFQEKSVPQHMGMI